MDDQSTYIHNLIEDINAYNRPSMDEEVNEVVRILNDKLDVPVESMFIPTTIRYWNRETQSFITDTNNLDNVNMEEVFSIPIIAKTLKVSTNIESELLESIEKRFKDEIEYRKGTDDIKLIALYKSNVEELPSTDEYIFIRCAFVWQSYIEDEINHQL